MGLRFEALLTMPVAPKGMVFALPNWAQGMKNSADKIKRSVRNKIRKFRDFLKERARTKGITVEELLKDPFFARWHEKERKGWRKQFQMFERYPDGSTRFDRGVDYSRKIYKVNDERYRREGHYPLYGSGKGKVKGLIFLGTMALTGDQGLEKCLKPGIDEIITGQPVCICPPEKLKEFRRRLEGLLAEFGWIIIESNFNPDMLWSGSVQLNRLVESYRSAKIEPFSPIGASYVDFIIVDFADRPVKRLGLRIKVSKKD